MVFSKIHERPTGYLELEDGSRFPGRLFGEVGSCDGEVVFNTGMVGYVESLTDPSYRGQILALTYPLIGNYGVPDLIKGEGPFQSDDIQVRGLVVQEYIDEHSHWEARMSLDDWLSKQGIVGIAGVDTRDLTKLLREKGTMRGRIVMSEGGPFSVEDPNAKDLVGEVSSSGAVQHGEGDGPHIVLVDCGAKRGILRDLLSRGCRVTVVPYDHDLLSMKCDGYMISNGPGDPLMCTRTIENVSALLKGDVPVAGICLGCQIIALASGASTYKLKYGHRSQNQPCAEKGTDRCYITSQNHGYAVDGKTLGEGWKVWYSNLNDGTVEGIRHEGKPFFAVQFHPEASPGPRDSGGFFDLFLEVVG